MNQVKDNPEENAKGVTISYKPWGKLKGKHVFLFKLKNSSGAFVELMNYGATIISIVVPDKQGILGNVVLGFPSLEGYVNDRCYIGSTIGRYANRIKDARFVLDDVIYYLDKNDNLNSNHGGLNGFHGRIFDFTVNSDSVSFTLVSKDGEGGYPGNIQFNVTYTWNDDNALVIRYEAVSDKRTVLNFTNHAYFNLAAEQGDILSHELSIYAREMLVMGSDHIPTGLIVPVGDKLFHRHVIRDKVTITCDTVKGLNSYYILERQKKNSVNHACTLAAPVSGRLLDIFTTYPGVQFYTGDFLGGEWPTSRFKFLKPFDGLCLECQHYPDAPNNPTFPSTIVDPGKAYDETIIYKFDTRIVTAS